MGTVVVGPCGGVALGAGGVGEAGGAGVAVAGGTVGVPPAERPGMVSFWPSASWLGSAMLLARTMSSTVTPKRAAMPERVSPGLTV